MQSHILWIKSATKYFGMWLKDTMLKNQDLISGKTWLSTLNIWQRKKKKPLSISLLTQWLWSMHYLQINCHRAEPGAVQLYLTKFLSPSARLPGAASPCPQSQDICGKNHPNGRSLHANLNLEICLPILFPSFYPFSCILESTNVCFSELEWTATLHNWAGWFWKDSTLLTWLE